MSRKGRKRVKNPRIKRKKRILIIEIIVLAVVCVAAFGSSWLKGKLDLVKHADVTDDENITTAIEANSTMDETESLKGQEMIALVGVDKRGNESTTGKYGNSDSMIIASIDHDNKSIKLVSLYRDTYLNIKNDKSEKDNYTKANAAYNQGGPTQMLSMMNLNLDLNLTKYISVNFQALADTIDLLGGVDIELCPAEIKNINEINKETASVTGYPYVELQVPEDQGDSEYRLTHLDAAQGMTYSRIRYTAGNDFRRAARQRILIEKILEKAKNEDAGTLNKILDKVLPQIETNIGNTKLLSLAKSLLSYSIDQSTGFPFDHIEDDQETYTGINCVIPVSLESNVRHLHTFLFNESDYQVSATVQEYSNYIISKTGLTEEDAPLESEDGSLPWDTAGGGSSSSGTESSSGDSQTQQGVSGESANPTPTPAEIN